MSAAALLADTGGVLDASAFADGLVSMFWSIASLMVAWTVLRIGTGMFLDLLDARPPATRQAPRPGLQPGTREMADHLAEQRRKAALEAVRRKERADLADARRLERNRKARQKRRDEKQAAATLHLITGLHHKGKTKEMMDTINQANGYGLKPLEDES